MQLLSLKYMTGEEYIYIGGLLGEEPFFLFSYYSKHQGSSSSSSSDSESESESDDDDDDDVDEMVGGGGGTFFNPLLIDDVC